jgi:uncharacterized membrane protein YjjP (DUF1212 family)
MNKSDLNFFFAAIIAFVCIGIPYLAGGTLIVGGGCLATTQAIHYLTDGYSSIYRFSCPFLFTISIVTIIPGLIIIKLLNKFLEDKKDGEK